jgi:hypothetical protein
MTEKDMQFFRDWFIGYAGSFRSVNREGQENFLLKQQHTINVCNAMRRITGELSLEKEQCMLAETIAWFHDVGRFSQYAEYRTFRDSISVNHAALGARVLSEKGILKTLEEREQELILHTVKYHNAYIIPDIHDAGIIFFLRLIRDADKIDIWRIFAEYHESPSEDRASAVGLGLPAGPGYSEDVLSCILQQRVVTLAALRNLNDFTLLQLSWIYDLNFRPAFRMLQEKDYLQKLMRTLPDSEEIRHAASLLQEYIHQKIQGTKSSLNA